MTTDPSSRKFEADLDITAPKDAVWRAITEAREIERWFAPSAEFEARVGGHVLWKWHNHHSWHQTVEILEPGQHLRTRYDSSVDDGTGSKQPLFIDFFLEGQSGATKLRLVHHGFGPDAAFDQEFDGISGGWPVELGSLRNYLENHLGQDRHIAWSLTKTDDQPEVAWQRLLDAGALDAAALDELTVGASYAVTVPGAGAISGSVLNIAPRSLNGSADNLNRGWFRLQCDGCGGTNQISIWLALYGEAGPQVASYQAAFDQLLAGVASQGEAALGEQS